MKAGTFKIIENWKFELVENATGKILHTDEYCNTVVNDGLERIAKLINGESSTHFNTLAIGTGTNAVQNDDATLQTEFTREAADLSYEADYKAIFSKRFSFASGVEEDITEAGIFDNAVSGGKMLARLVFDAKSVDAEIDLIVTATITVARA